MYKKYRAAACAVNAQHGGTLRPSVTMPGRYVKLVNNATSIQMISTNATAAESLVTSPLLVKSNNRRYCPTYTE